MKEVGIMKATLVAMCLVFFMMPGARAGITIKWDTATGVGPVVLAEDKTMNPICTAVATITVTIDPATGLPPPLFYTLAVSPSDGKFNINPQTGVITHVPNPNFNYEFATPSRYIFTVKAFSGIVVSPATVIEESLPLTINFDLTNVNEAPKITNLPKCLNVYENKGKEDILDVSVIDPDGYSNDVLDKHPFSYIITDKEPPTTSIFEIDKPTYAPPNPVPARPWNKLKTTDSMKYEIQDNYNISIYVKDMFGGGSPPLESRKHKVAVQVIDVNEPPEFHKTTTTTCEVYENTGAATANLSIVWAFKEGGQTASACLVTVRTSSVHQFKCVYSKPIGTTVSTGIYPFRAFDPDKYQGANCLTKIPESVEYFVGGKFSKLFRMKTVNVTAKLYQDGYLVVNAPIDREESTNKKDAPFTMYVGARDSRGMRSSNEVQVDCKILDVDDHPTICKDYIFDATLTENTPFDTPVVTVSCSDKDDTATYPITYTIKDVGVEADATLADQYFQFGSTPTNPLKSTLLTKQRLNLEGGSVLKFKVLATQGAAFSQMSTTLTFEVSVVGHNDHRPTMDKDFYNFFVAYNEPNNFVIGNVSASDIDQPATAMSYFLVEKAEGIMLGTKSGRLYVDYTNIKKDSIISNKTLMKNHTYWMSARANDNDKPPFYSNHVYVRVNSYVKKLVLVNIEVAVGIADFHDSQLADFERSISNICKPCKGICPQKYSKGSNTVISCFALKDDRTFQKTNKAQPTAFLHQDELIDYLTSEKLVAGDIYGFGAYDIVSVTPYDKGPDLLPLWIVLGILGLIGLIVGLTFAIKACIAHGMCKQKPKATNAKRKSLHPASYDVDTFNFNYAEHAKGPV